MVGGGGAAGGGRKKKKSECQGEGLQAVQQNTLWNVCTLLLSALLKHTLTSVCVHQVVLGAAG